MRIRIKLLFASLSTTTTSRLSSFTIECLNRVQIDIFLFFCFGFNHASKRAPAFYASYDQLLQSSLPQLSVSCSLAHAQISSTSQIYSLHVDVEPIGLYNNMLVSFLNFLMSFTLRFSTTFFARLIIFHHLWLQICIALRRPCWQHNFWILVIIASHYLSSLTLLPNIRPKTRLICPEIGIRIRLIFEYRIYSNISIRIRIRICSIIFSSVRIRIR